ncbi:MAG: NTPase [Bacteroidales bacterium]|nr:NTPase [Bacteroidales bacterium]
MKNKSVNDFLLEYMKNPDPQYAIMLKGNWGSGKTFFIKKWIKDYKDNLGRDIILEPIYVSLYGLKDTTQITTEIDRQLNPILYSKGADITKKVLRLASKIVLRTDIDLDNDKTEDLQINATLDSLYLLTSKGDKDSNIGSKLIIFDDLERCNIDVKNLLGYINSFVEHGACHVIIIGDETKVEDKDKLQEFKEKTIGREFEIVTDEENALDCFIEEMKLTDYIGNNREFILDCFKSTKCNNLRLLRQSIYDFNTLYNELNSNLINEKSKCILQSILGSYIVIYCEYKGSNHDKLKNWTPYYFPSGLGNKDDENIKQIIDKYKQIEYNYNINVLNAENVKQIINEIETGCTLKEYVNGLLAQNNKEISPYEKLTSFSRLSNAEFKEAYKDLKEKVKNKEIPNMYQMGEVIGLLICIEQNNICTITEELLDNIKTYIKEQYDSIDNKEDLYKTRTSFYYGLNSWNRITDSIEEKNDIVDFLEEQFKDRDSKLKNEMEEALLNLNNNNVKSLIDLSTKSTCDKGTTYQLTSVFKNIDAKTIAKKILNLNNESLIELCLFFFLSIYV